MSYYPEPDSHIRDNIKVVLDLSNYAKTELEHSTGIDTSDVKPIDADYYLLTENIDTNSKPPKFKVNDRVRFTK